MTAPGLLEKLLSHDIALYLDGDRLRWRGPAGAMTEELKDALRQQRDELRALVEIEELMREYGLGRCRRCRRILVMSEFGDWVDGLLECLDRGDCGQAAAVARWNEMRATR